jgi:hypothetical protein
MSLNIFGTGGENCTGLAPSLSGDFLEIEKQAGFSPGAVRPS